MISVTKNILFGFDSHALPPLFLKILNAYHFRFVQNTTNKLLTFNNNQCQGVTNIQKELKEGLESRRRA